MKCPNCAAVILDEFSLECPECGVRLERQMTDSGHYVFRRIADHTNLLDAGGQGIVTQEGGIDGALWCNAIHRSMWPTDA